MPKYGSFANIVEHELLVLVVAILLWVQEIILLICFYLSLKITYPFIFVVNIHIYNNNDYKWQ
jgi:hypothetical protein